jgi:hypothetical protein
MGHQGTGSVRRPEINGILDTPTMKAIYTFQQANHNLQVCGVPTPRTRKMLEQGSHTDLASKQLHESVPFRSNVARPRDSKTRVSFWLDNFG